MQLFVLSMGRVPVCHTVCCTGFCLLGFLYIHYFHFSFERKKSFCLCSWMCCFLSAVGASVKIVGCQGRNSLTKISCQVTMSERIRYLSVAAIHKVWNLNVCSQVQAGSLTQLREPHTSRQPWLWVLQECRPPDREVWQFCQYLSVSHKFMSGLKLQAKPKHEAGAPCLGRWLCGRSLYVSVKTWILQISLAAAITIQESFS